MGQKLIADKALMKLLTDCKFAVCKHLQVNNRDINPKDITFCGALLPSAKMILKYGDDLFVAELTDDKTRIEVRQLVTMSCSIWDAL